MELNSEATEVKVHVELGKDAQLTCPRCGTACADYVKRTLQCAPLRHMPIQEEGTTGKKVIIE